MSAIAQCHLLKEGVPEAMILSVRNRISIPMSERHFRIADARSPNARVLSAPASLARMNLHRRFTSSPIGRLS